MANIGILNFPGHHNHGANLTAYALQVVLEDMGHTAKNVILHCNYQQYKNPLYTDFSDTYIKAAEADAYGEAGMQRFNAEFDTFIVGSDQVWRRENSRWMGWKHRFDPCFWLRFAEPGKRRIGMAASFGNDTFEASPRVKAEFVEELRKYTAISVREESGRDIIRDLAGLESARVIDPVFMLPAARWEEVMSPPIAHAKPVIAYSSFVGRDYIEREIIPAFPEYEFVDVLTISTQEMLRTLKEAAFVITDSFHVTCFCIIFGTSFSILIVNTPLAVARYSQLAATFRFSQERIIDAAKQPDTAAAIRACMAAPLDREEIQEAILRESTATRAWLEQALATQPAEWKSPFRRLGALSRLWEKLHTRRWRYLAKHRISAKVFGALACISPVARGKLAGIAAMERDRVEKVTW